MGAGTTEVRDSTTDVLLEAAVWDPAAVSRTQRRLHLTARRAAATNAASTPPFRWPRWTGARRCSPRSPAAQPNPR